ncbi:MAG: ATP-binding protein [Lachnospiraceae bacterium]
MCYAPKISGLPVFYDQKLQQLLRLSRKETACGEQTDRFVYLEGKPGDGRTVLAAQYAEQMGRQLLVLELPVLVGMTPEKADAQICDVLTLLCITDSILLIRGCTEPLLMTEAARMLFSRCLKHAAGWEVLLSGEPIEAHSLYKTQLYRIDRLMPGVHTRLAMWQLFAKERALDPQISLEELADCYELSVGTIARILQQAGMDADAQGAAAISRPVLLAAVNRMNTVHFSTLATRIRTVYTWDDLELPAAGKQVLIVACNRYKMRNRISEDWGLASKNAYGNGVSVLLYGPPGTGKTMAAQVIANEIGMELYRIDLSQIVSKYIGETQKNMSAVFEEAQKANVVLFFDEADALFSKRTEVNNSNDKYANSETAYLLQKVEEYKGVSINFDSAFVRRLTYAVRFENPDEQTRYRLWTTTLPSQVPFAPDIDFRFLAENFELTGSNIKAILYSAAYMAAADGGVIMECHIARAMKYEFEKLGKMYQRGDFGKFAIYLQ